MRMKLILAAVFLIFANGTASAESDWPTFGGPAGGGQSSSLSQITPANVGTLKQAWVYHTGEKPVSAFQSLESGILHANDRLYLCTPMGKTVALDPATGKELWSFQAGSESEGGVHGVGMCRGVTYWAAASPVAKASCQKRIFTPGRGPKGPVIYALDAETGALCQDFGAKGGHPGRIEFADFDWGGEVKFTSSSSPGVIYKNVLILGEGVGDNIKANMADGYIRAFDTQTGEQVWSFSPIPPELSATTGAANVWSIMSVDAVRGMIFLPTTSPSPDLYGGQRKADIPYADAVVALRADTGAIAWSFQTVHHDIFDFDLPAEPILATLPINGKDVDVVVQTTKTGFTFVLDRDTGKPVYPVTEKPVPKSDIPGEESSPTQPQPPLPEVYARQTLTRDELFGLTPIDRAACRNLFDKSRYDGMYTPVSFQGSIMFPSLLGGGNWGGAAYDAASHLLIVKSSNLATWARLIDKATDKDPKHVPQTWMDAPMGDTPFRMEGKVFVSPLGIPCTPPPWGTLTAIDLSTGKKAWQIPLGQSKHFGITAPAFLGWGSPSVGGPLVTGSGLIFIGATLDSKFRAYDLKTGKELWQEKLPAPGMTVPVTYQAGGRQYVAISAGGNALAETELDDAVVAYSLP
jgi:quinoprotein glucose dehydrogenase